MNDSSRPPWSSYKIFYVLYIQRGMLQLISRDIRNVFSHNCGKLNNHQSRYINRQVVKTHLALTRQIFNVCNMPKLSLATCCKVLQEIATIQKSKTMSPLTKGTSQIDWNWWESTRKCISPMWYSLINAMLPWLNQISGPNARSPPTIVLQFEYIVSKVDEGSCSG